MTDCIPGKCPVGQTCKRATKKCELTRKNKKMTSIAHIPKSKSNSPKNSPKMFSVPQEVIKKYIQREYDDNKGQMIIKPISQYEYSISNYNTHSTLYIFTADTFADVLTSFYNIDDGGGFLTMFSSVPYRKMYKFLTENSSAFKKTFPKYKLYDYYFQTLYTDNIDNYNTGDLEPEYDVNFSDSKLKTYIEQIGINKVIDFIVTTAIGTKFNNVDASKIKFKGNVYFVNESM